MKKLRKRWVSVTELHKLTGVSTTTIYSYLALNLLTIKDRNGEKGRYLIDVQNLPESFKCRYDPNYMTPNQFCQKWKIPADDYTIVSDDHKDKIIKRPNQIQRKGYVDIIHEPTWLKIFMDLNLYPDEPNHPITEKIFKKIEEDQQSASDKLKSLVQKTKEQIEDASDQSQLVFEEDSESETQESTVEERVFNVSYSPPRPVRVTLQFNSIEERDDAIRKWLGLNLTTPDDLTLYVHQK